MDTLSRSHRKRGRLDEIYALCSSELEMIWFGVSSGKLGVVDAICGNEVANINHFYSIRFARRKPS